MKILTDKEGRPILLPDGKVICVDDVVQIKDVQIADSGVSIFGADGIGKIPIADNIGNPGLIKVLGTSGSTGIRMTTINGIPYIAVNGASNERVLNRTGNLPLLPSNIPLAVKSAMSALVSTTDPAWTEDEQKNTHIRLGLSDDYELIESFILDSDRAWEKLAEPNGTPYNFKKVYVSRYYPAGSNIINVGYGRLVFEDANNKFVHSESKRHSSNSVATGNISYLERLGNEAYMKYTQTGAINGDLNFYTRFSNYSRYASSGIVLPTIGNITKIYLNSGDADPEGTIINIFAVRA